MRRHELLLASPHSASGVRRGDSATESLSAVNQRLANAERELRVQFIRMAQLQAQLDLVLSALRAARADGTVIDSARRRSPDIRERLHIVSAEDRE